jgi:uncharacterized protein (DUF427 family)
VGPLPVAGHGAVGRWVPVTHPHRTDPHRITVDPVPGTVRVSVDGTTIARSTDAPLLQEGSLPPRYHLPRDGVRHEDLVWSYEEPIAGHRTLTSTASPLAEIARVSSIVSSKRRSWVTTRSVPS